jgi:hypothetical protein
MGLKLIFRTKLDDNENYQGFEFLDSEVSLSAEDLIKMKDIERKIYNSQSHLEEEEMIKLSIGSVKIKSFIHPTAYRRRMIEGFIEVPEPEVIEPEPIKIDTRAKELHIKYRKDLFALRQPSDAEDDEQLILALEKYILKQLENKNCNIEVHDLLIGSPESLKHTLNEENTKLIAAINFQQDFITLSKQPKLNEREAK